MSLHALPTAHHTICPTAATAALTEALRAAPALGRLVLITGQHGWGKTAGLDLAATELVRLRRVDINPQSSTARGFWLTICRALDLPTQTYDGADALSRRAYQRLGEQGDLLVLDGAEQFRPTAMPHLRHLIDLVETVAVVGGPALEMKIFACDDLSARLTFALDMPAATIGELTGHLGQEFSSDWLTIAHAAAWSPGGRHSERHHGFGWSTIAAMAEIERIRSMHHQRATSDAGADDARIAARRLRLTA